MCVHLFIERLHDKRATGVGDKNGIPGKAFQEAGWYSLRLFDLKETVPGQQVGLKIRNFKRAKKNDQVEVFETIMPGSKRWQPRGTVFDLRYTKK